MEETLAPKAEKIYREINSMRISPAPEGGNDGVNQKKAFVTVRILNGVSALENLWIEDQTVLNFLKTQQPA